MGVSLCVVNFRGRVGEFTRAGNFQTKDSDFRSIIQLKFYNSVFHRARTDFIRHAMARAL